MRRKLLGLGLSTLVAVGGTFAFRAARGGAEEPQSSNSGSGGATTTARLERQDLVVSDGYNGTLGYGEPRELVSERAGVVTSVADAKTNVGQGGELWRIDFEPTVLLTGEVPAYRALDTSSADGPDVRQLEQGLADAGQGTGVTVDEHFDSGTAAAVKRWEKALGRKDPNGKVELGDVIFLPNTVRVASITSAKGSRVQAGATILEATPTTKVVTVDLDPSRAGELEPGTKVQLTMPDDAETTGTVTTLGNEEEAEGPAIGGPSTIPVTISLDDQSAADEFDSGSVDVDLERSRTEGATVAPVTALMALAEGGYAVQLVDKSAPRGYRLVAVDVQSHNQQMVAITGKGIEPGAEVVVPK